jgi:hypothetical protein
MHDLVTSEQALFGIDIAALSTRGLLAIALVTLVALGCWCIRAQLR